MFGRLKVRSLRRKLERSLAADPIQDPEWRAWLPTVETVAGFQDAPDAGWLVHVAYWQDGSQDGPTKALVELALSLPGDGDESPLQFIDYEVLENGSSAPMVERIGALVRIDQRCADPEGSIIPHLQAHIFDHQTILDELGRRRAIVEAGPGANAATVLRGLAHHDIAPEEDPYANVRSTVESLGMPGLANEIQSDMERLIAEATSERGGPYREHPGEEVNADELLTQLYGINLQSERDRYLPPNLPPTTTQPLAWTFAVLMLRDYGARDALFEMAGKAAALFQKLHPDAAAITRRHLFGK